MATLVPSSAIKDFACFFHGTCFKKTLLICELLICELKPVTRSWPFGHVLLLPNGADVHACYVGADKPKLLFLMDCKQCNYPLVTVVAATVDSPGLPLGTLPQWGLSCWKIRGGHQDPDFVIEQRDCQWIMNIGAWHTRTQECPTCQLCNIGRLVACPWHKSPGTTLDPTSLRVVHMVCEKDDNTSVVRLKGVLDHLPEGGNFLDFSCLYAAANFAIGQAMSSFPISC